MHDFFPEPADFSASEGPRLEFPTARNCPKKIKSINFNKLFPKRNRKDRTWHTSFFTFDFLNFKLMQIDSKLRFALENKTYFYQKCERSSQKSSETWKCGLKLKKKGNLCDRKVKDGGSAGTSLHIWDPRICGCSIGLVNF